MFLAIKSLYSPSLTARYNDIQLSDDLAPISNISSTELSPSAISASINEITPSAPHVIYNANPCFIPNAVQASHNADTLATITGVAYITTTATITIIPSVTITGIQSNKSIL